MIEDNSKINKEDMGSDFAVELEKAKPTVNIDPKFQAVLRTQLLDHASTTKNNNIKHSWFMTWNKFFLGFGTSLVVVAIAWFAIGNTKLGGPKNAVQILSGEYKVTNSSANSFGSLTSASNTVALADGAENNAARPQSGGGSEMAVGFAAPSTSGGMGGGMGGDSKMIYPYPEVNYKYEYKGEALPEIAADQAVFKRVKGLDGSPSNSILDLIRLGLFNLQKLSSVSLENLTLTENRENGYSVNLNFVEGSANLYENWKMWNSPDRQCRDEACYNKYRLRFSDVPDDAAIISVADKFIADYGISRDRYGAPKIQDYWRQDYLRSPDKNNYYIPDVISIVYPYVIDNKVVYDESGMSTGLNVAVNIRKMLVSNVGEITTQQYLSSPYAGFTDHDKILALAEKGGFRNYYGYPIPLQEQAGQTKVTTVELGTPVLGMMRFWKYDIIGTSDELYIPALIFPVTNREEIGFYRESVIVPLVKEIIENDTPPPYSIMEDSVSSDKAVETQVAPAPAPEVRVLPAQ